MGLVMDALVDFDLKDFKVISGAQTGSDRAGLIVARNFGFATGGWIPKGCKTTDGFEPWLVKEFGLIETEAANYQVRTELNAKNSDATIRLALDFTTAGERLTIRCATKHQKSVFDVNPFDRRALDRAPEFVRFIRRHRVLTLNVAGNSERSAPGITEKSIEVLTHFFNELSKS